MTTEAMEVRLLLTATSDCNTIQPNDANLETTDLPLSDDWMLSTEDVWLEDSSADFDSAFSDFAFDTSTLYAEPDYEAFLQDSPLASSVDSANDPLPEQIAEYEAMIQAAQQQAAFAADIEALSETSSYPEAFADGELHDGGVQQETMQAAEGSDSGTLADYVDEFLNSTSDADGMPAEEISSPQQTSETSASDSTPNSTDASTTPFSDSTDSGTSDPPFNWNPMQAPDGVTFDDSHFVGYSFLDDPFSVTPTGTESFEDQQTSVTQLAPEATDSEPGSGERQRQLTTTISTKQDYVSDDEWTVTYTLTNQYDDQEQLTDSDDSQTETGRNYQTTLTITVTNGTKVTTSWTVSDSFQFGAGAIPGEEDNDDPWTIPESWLDDAQRSVNDDTDSATEGSADEQIPTGFGVDSEDSTSEATQATAASSSPETSSSSSNGSDTGSSDADSSHANGSGVFFTAGYSKSITNTVEKVTLANNVAATRTTNSYSWSSFFSLRIGGSYDSSQASSTITKDSPSDDSGENDDLSPVTYGSTDPADAAAENAETETTTSDATASDGGTDNTVPSPYSDFKPVAKGSFKAFATGSMAAAFSTTRTVPDSLSNFFSGSGSASAAFAISALAGYNSSSSLKGDLDQSSGSESDNTDEHLKIHVDNSSSSATSAGFSFWFGVSVGSNAATTGDPTDSTTTNTTTSTVDGQTTITTTDADGNVTTTDVNGNPVDPVPNQPELPPDPDANSSASAPKPGRQSASDLIADNPTGIQLAVATNSSSKETIRVFYSFKEQLEPSVPLLINSGHSAGHWSETSTSSSDTHFTLALGTESNEFEVGLTKANDSDESWSSTEHIHYNYEEENQFFANEMFRTQTITESGHAREKASSSSAFKVAGDGGQITADNEVDASGGTTYHDNTVWHVWIWPEPQQMEGETVETGPVFLYDIPVNIVSTVSYTFAGNKADGYTGSQTAITTEDFVWVTESGEIWGNAHIEITATTNLITGTTTTTTTATGMPPGAPPIQTGTVTTTAPSNNDQAAVSAAGSPEQILDEYQARATNIARWQEQLTQTTDPAMRLVLQAMIASEQNILADLTAAAIAAGITQDQLNQAGSNAQTAAANNPIDLQQSDGGDSVTGAYWHGFFFGGQYLHFLTNPSEMDADLETGFYGAVGTAGVALTLAGGLAAWPVIAEFGAAEFALPAFGLGGGGLALAGAGSTGGTIIIGGGTVTGGQILAGAGILGGWALFMSAGEWRSPSEWAEHDHGVIRDQVRQQMSGFESGRHNTAL